MVTAMTPEMNLPAREQPADAAIGEIKGETMIACEELSFSYDHGKTNTLDHISLNIPEKQVTAFIGPSGCGKSTFLRCFNRMNDLIDTARVTTGQIRIMGQDIHASGVDVIELR
jgi:phosphate transport system ATP-binding protein